MNDQLVLTENDIYERMVEAILNHRLPPGTKLIEDRLATAFAVSRTRIRPVLVRLANEQIVVLTPNRGATVAKPTEKEAREVFQVRRMIESTLIECFIDRANAADLDVLTACMAAEELARNSGDIRRAIRLSGDFHLHIANAANHQTLGRILRELVSRTSLILMTYGVGNMQASSDATTTCGCQAHHALLDAIRLRDSRLAASLMRDHLQHLESQLVFEFPEEDVPDLASLFGVAHA